MTRLQIATLNIGGHRHLSEKPLNAAQIARDVKSILPLDPALPTLLAVQEATAVWRDDEMTCDGELLARGLGENYRFLFAPEVDSQIHAHSTIWQRPIYRGYTRAQNGNGIITNLATASWLWSVPSEGYPGAGGAQAISTTISHARLYSTGSRDTQPRNLIITALESPFGALFFISTHLSTRRGEERRNPAHPISARAAAERQFEAQQILTIVEELRAAEREQQREAHPIILAGDFNAEPNTDEMRVLQEVFTSIPPRANDKGTHINHSIHIDHILITDPASKLPPVESCYVYDDPEMVKIIDHRPVIAILAR